MTPDDQIIFAIEDMILANGKGPFRQIWVLGEKVCQEVGADVEALA